MKMKAKACELSIYCWLLLHLLAFATKNNAEARHLFKGAVTGNKQ